MNQEVPISQPHEDCRWWHAEFDKILMLVVFLALVIAWAILHAGGNQTAADKVDNHVETVITAIVTLAGARALRRSANG